MTANATQDFIEKVGLIMQAEGFPRIAGQILGYLVMAGEPRTLTQMTKALSISKGSASTNARLLEDKRAINRVSPLGSRGDAYEACDQPYVQMMTELTRRFRTNAAAIAAVAERFDAGDNDKRARAEEMIEFMRHSATFLEEWLVRLEQMGATALTSE
ncbi:MAG: GbsR/MarR family transcriptional regulator [Maritimibacter sp.]